MLLHSFYKIYSRQCHCKIHNIMCPYYFTQLVGCTLNELEALYDRTIAFFNVTAHLVRRLVVHPRHLHRCHGYYSQQVSDQSVSCPVGSPSVRS